MRGKLVRGARVSKGLGVFYMGKMLLLDNSLFDDGSLECKNFTVSDSEGYYVCEWEWIKNKFAAAIHKRIAEAVVKGEYYIGIEGINKGDRYFEISWD